MLFGGHDHALTGLPAAFFRPAVREGEPPVVAGEKHGHERRVPVHDGLLARTVPRADHSHTVVFRVDRVMLRVNVNGISRDWLWFRSCRHFASVSLWNRSRETAQAYPSGATSDSAARNGVGCVGAASQRAAPPLRTTGCLKSQNSSRYALHLLGPLKFAPKLSLWVVYISEFRVHHTQAQPQAG